LSSQLKNKSVEVEGDQREMRRMVEEASALVRTK
jgi:hypothetical protein